MSSTTNVYFVSSPGKRTLKLDDAKDLPVPQEDLFITLKSGTGVIEDGCLPYELSVDTKAKLPENCKLILPTGVRLQGPDGLLLLQHPATVELAPRRKPMAEITTPNKATPNKATPNEKDEKEIDVLFADIINQVKDIKDMELLSVINQNIEWIIFKAITIGP